MESTVLESVRNLLLGLLRDRESTIRNRDEIVVENAPDTIDRVQRNSDRELAVRQIQFDFDRLQSIRVALQRVDDGTYGICLRCDAAMGRKRLNVVPWALYCVKCQEIADRQSKEEGNEQLMGAR